MRVIAVVPARGGSKGIPRKNLREVGGRSLVGWAVKAGLEAKLVSEVFVSSEDDDILAEGVWHGATALKRPAELATDTASTDAVLYHAATELGWRFDLMVLLQPTVPYRRAGLVDDCVERLVETGADSLFTGHLEHFIWRRAVRTRHDGTKVPGPLVQINCRGQRLLRQEFQPEDYRWTEDGAVFLVRASVLAETRSRLGGQIEVYENGRTVDIDTEADFAVAASLLTLDNQLAKCL